MEKGIILFVSDASLTATLDNGCSRIFVSRSHSGVNNWMHAIVNIDRSGSIVKNYV